MFINLINAISYWFSEDQNTGIPEEYTVWVWLGVAALAVILLFSIIVLFFKACRRSRERKLEKRIRKEVIQETKIEQKEEKRSKKEK